MIRETKPNGGIWQILFIYITLSNINFIDMTFKVLNKTTGKEEIIRPAKYAAYGPQVYQKIATIDDDGNETPIGASPNNAPQAKEKKGAEPVVIDAPKFDPNPLDKPLYDPSDDQDEADPAPKEEPTPAKPTRKKPGPKPRNKAISSQNEELE